MEVLADQLSVHEATLLLGPYHTEILSPYEVEYLAETLSRPEGLDKVVEDFDNGNTLLRDVSGLTQAERSIVLNTYEGNPLKKALCDKAVQSLRDFIRSPVYPHELAAYNFLANMQEFAQDYSDEPWMKAVDQRFRDRYKIGIASIVDHLNQSPHLVQHAERILGDVLGNPANNEAIGTFLAYRSRHTETYQTTLFNNELNITKNEVRARLPELFEQYDISVETKARVMRQLERTTFSAFDHMVFGVTSGDMGASGDYLGYTLRVEVKFNGTHRQRSIPSAEQVIEVLRHELMHAASAQIEHNDRIGLLANRKGKAVNEAMTEYLAQVIGNFPNIRVTNDNEISITCAYPQEVRAMLVLQSHEPIAFKTLFRAYFGELTDTDNLRMALNKFYRILAHYMVQETVP